MGKQLRTKRHGALMREPAVALQGAGMTQRDLAKRLDRAHSFVGKIKSGSASSTYWSSATYSTEYGLTKRLAKSFACPTDTRREERDGAYKRFIDLYSTRSDIMHGRMYNIEEKEKARFTVLSEFEALTRDLWNAVINSPAALAALEGGDAQRAQFFADLESGYLPPPIARNS